VLDVVSERRQALTATLGPSDKRKLDEYFYGVREIERQIERAEKDQREITPTLEKPAGIPAQFADYAKLMFDLQVAAFETDVTRVSTLMIGREGSLQTYPEIGVPDSHHPLTHHRGAPELVEKVTKVNTFHAELFSYFVDRLKNTHDADGSLLDNTMVVYGSAISDGDRHTHEDLPVLLVGKGGGSLKSGRHLVYPADTPMTNLYLTLLDRIGVKPESIGDSTGRLEHLTDL
jgi:hypothetical protein